MRKEGRRLGQVGITKGVVGRITTVNDQQTTTTEEESDSRDSCPAMVEARPCLGFKATYHTLSFSLEKSNPVQKEIESIKKKNEKVDKGEN